MKSLMFISLFTLVTWCGSYPQTRAICEERLGSVPEEWMYEPDARPSKLAALNVSLAEREDAHEDHPKLALTISWAISIDQSNDHLVGTWIRVVGYENSFRCQYQPPFNEIDTTGYEQLWFNLTGVEAEPEKTYYVIGYNIPTPMIGDDPGSKVTQFRTPGCSNKTMMHHDSCVRKGCIWDPNVTSIHSKNQVEVSFTSSKYSTEYIIRLCRSKSEMECTGGEYISKVTTFTEGESRWLTTLNSTGPCDLLHIELVPTFPGWHPHCARTRTAKVSCTPTGKYHIIMS
ncbi:hypothetical protein MATL_G00106990 [Megalops atlanticus]|uniref:IL17RA/B N-terminal domain-containing protein n=1 Tax=Megalops atlanticus TaxID=7932 RepID=A0A9D3Q003_MEGAT|nr:hypothetical protein MATL_G00106990 [Megalops atlanticus]